MERANVVSSLTAAIVVGAVLAAVPAAAMAAAAASGPVDTSPQLLVSEDGVEFAETLRGPLFAGIGALVPGDVVTDSVWIFNPTNAQASIRVSGRNGQVSSEAWADDAELTIWNSGTLTAESTTVGALRDCAVLVPAQTVPAGEAIEIALELAVGDWSGVAGQNGSAGFELVASMRDAEAGPFAASACEDDAVIVDVGQAPPGAGVSGAGSASTGGGAVADGLAWTGPIETGLMAVIGGTLFGLGALLFSARRRRDVSR